AQQSLLDAQLAQMSARVSYAVARLRLLLTLDGLVLEPKGLRFDPALPLPDLTAADDVPLPGADVARRFPPPTVDRPRNPPYACTACRSLPPYSRCRGAVRIGPRPPPRAPTCSRSSAATCASPSRSPPSWRRRPRPACARRWRGRTRSSTSSRRAPGSTRATSSSSWTRAR